MRPRCFGIGAAGMATGAGGGLPTIAGSRRRRSARPPGAAIGRRRWRAGALVSLGLAASAGVSCAREADAPPVRSVLLVSVDTLRRDHLGTYGDRRGLTPQLDRLASESVVFERAYAPAPFTLPSVASLLTGRRPEAIGITSNVSALAADEPTLASRLRAQGLATAAVVSNYVLGHGAGLAEGFDLYDDAMEDHDPTRGLPVRYAEATTDAALRALDAMLAVGGRGWLLWVHYQDPHGPYLPPADARERHLPWAARARDARRHLPLGSDNTGLGAIPRYQYVARRHDPAFYRAGYAAQVERMDAAVGRLLAGIEERGEREGTLVVFTSDHGEGLGERDYWFAHGEFLTDELVQVPLLVHAAGRAPKRRHDVVWHPDILSTVLGALGESPPPTLRGRDLLARGAERRDSVPILASFHASTIPRFGVVVGDRKYVAAYDGSTWTEEVRALGARGERRRNAGRGEIQRLRAEMARARTGLPDFAEARAAGPAPTRTLSVQEADLLRALGYVVEPSPAPGD